MVRSCCVVKCTNRKTKDTPWSFHSFPLKDPERKDQWIKNISRNASNGKPWYPTGYDSVCSAHFTPDDYRDDIKIKCLKDTAVPTVFPHYPAHKQPRPSPKRPPPKQRFNFVHKLPRIPKYRPKDEHSYCHSSVDEHLKWTQKRLAEVEAKLVAQMEKNKLIAQKALRRGRRNVALLGKLKEKKKSGSSTSSEAQNVISESFEDSTMSIIESEPEVEPECSS